MGIDTSVSFDITQINQLSTDLNTLSTDVNTWHSDSQTAHSTASSNWQGQAHNAFDSHASTIESNISSHKSDIDTFKTAVDTLYNELSAVKTGLEGARADAVFYGLTVNGTTIEKPEAPEEPTTCTIDPETKERTCTDEEAATKMDEYNKK